MATYILDTDIISPILKRNQDGMQLKEKMQSILKRNDNILLSPIVFYEIIRGLYYSEAKPLIAFFEELSGYLEWRDLTKSVWDEGAKLWAKCRKSGTPTGEGIDKDVLIAAQAKEYNAIVVTRNDRHFKYLDVKYDIW